MSVKSPFNPSGTKKVILSIDGGGMRGIIPIAMLAELERLTGTPCHQMFDMVAGTSTGSIIAVGMAIGLPATTILEEVYRTRLPSAFTNAPLTGFYKFLRDASVSLKLLSSSNADLFLRLLSNGLRYAFPTNTFIDYLKPLVGNKTVGELSSEPVLFATAKDVASGEMIYIISAGRGRERVKDWPLAGVVAASGAAPVFFPAVANRLVDGSVGAFCNPCLGASIEAMEYVSQSDPGYKDGNVVHISLGTGSVANQVAPKAIARYNALDWLRYIAVEGIDESATQQVFSTRAIYGPERMDFRRYNPTLSAAAVQTALGIDLAGKPEPNTLGLSSYSPADVALMEEIGTQYSQRIDWAKPNVMPWSTVGGQCHPNDADCNPELAAAIAWPPELR